jgi:Carboxypeptidase regulatory-like domain
MIRKNAPTYALCAVMLLLTACGAANAPTVPSSTVVTPPAPTTGTVQGIVKRAAFFGATFNPEAPLAGAQVLVTEGVGAGQSVTTGGDGAYRFELPAGPFRLRWSASSPFFETRDSNPGVVVAGSTTAVDVVVLRFAEWRVSGIVRDGVGNPVAGAWVTVDGFLIPIADATTDAAGRYRIVSTAQHADAIQVKASIPGYISQYTIVTCGPACTITADFRLLRSVRVWLDGPSAMQVGEVAGVTFVTDFDDGSQTRAATPLESSNPAVVRVLPLQPPYEATYVKAISPGTVTLRLALSKPLLLNVRVF